jgi:hypothetical protein
MSNSYNFNAHYTETPLRNNKLISNDEVIFNISFDTFASYSEPFRNLISGIVDFKEPIKIDAKAEDLESFLDTFHKGPNNIKITESIAYKIAMLSFQWDLFWCECRELIINSSPSDEQLNILYSNNILSDLANKLIMKGVEFFIRPSQFNMDKNNLIAYCLDRESYFMSENSYLKNKIEFLETVIKDEQKKREHVEKKHKNLLNARKRTRM